MDIYSNTRYYIFAAFLIIFMNLGGCGVGNSTAPLVDANHPQGLIANSGSRIVELSWNGIPSATSYTIYWSNSENVNRYDSATINTQEPYFQHRDLANGINYYYIVSAHTGAGESAPSDVVVGIPQAAPPALPENIKLRPDDKRVTIDFDIVAGATNYTLYWSNEDDVSKTSNRIDNIFPPFVHTGLTNAQPYYYLLLTQNAQGQTSSTEILSAIPQKALPMAPVITEAATINDKVTITWNDISNAENFDLYWGTHKDITIDDASISKVSSPYIFAPIEKAAGKHYYFRVIAHNSAGTSLLSNEVEIETPDTVIISSPGAAPGAPKISDSNGTQLVSVDIEDRQLTLNWVATPGEESLGYNLYWKKGSGSAIEDINIDKDDYDQKIVNIKPPYTHVGLQNDIYYYYRISAINNGGESELSQHPVIVAKPEIVKPGIPTGVNVIGGDGQIVVSWNPVQRASNYNVSLYNGDTTTDYTNANSPFTISELKNGSVYGIRVYAINGIKSGEGSASIESSPKEPVTNAPEVLTASPGNRLVTLQWTTASPQHVDDKEELAKNYRIYYRTRSGVTPNNGILLESPEIIQLKDQELWQTTIPDLKNGQRYYFVVTAVNAGGESQASPQAWALPQAEIPNAPQNVYAEAGNNKITIHFTGIGDAQKSVYNLYWSKETKDGRTATQVITNISQDPPYVFADGNSNGNTYFFQVSALNASGESTLSSEVVASPQTPVPAIAPQDISVRPGNNYNKISWENVADASTYSIYWSTDSRVAPGNRVQIIANDGKIGYQHKSLTNGQHYYYRIAALNEGGEGPLSDIYVAQPQVNPPATPKDIDVLSENESATIAWSTTYVETGIENGPGRATSYDLYWHDKLSEPLSKWRLVRGVLPGYTLSNLTNGLTYYFRIIASNPGGQSSPSSTVIANPTKPAISAPNIPMGLSATPNEKRIFLNWNTQEKLNYTVYWSRTSNKPFQNGTSVHNVSPTWIHGETNPLQNGQRYYYQVTASNEGGESLPSAVVFATPTFAPAGSPTSLASTADIDSINLSWLAPENAEDETIYTLYWSELTIAENIPDGTSKILNVTSPFIHKNLNIVSDYYYRVTATNPGTMESAPSNETHATTLLAIPAIPGGLNVVAGDMNNTISWDSVIDANEYVLEFATNTLFISSTSIIINAPDTNYLHDSLTNEIEVFYRVSARNGAGNSEPSAYDSGTPQHLNDNSTPVFGNIDDRINIEGDTISGFNITATDADTDTIIYTATGYPVGINFSTSNATFSGTLAADSGRSTPYFVTVTANDQSGEDNATASISFEWQVNDIISSASLSSASILPANSVSIGDELTLNVTVRDSNGIQRTVGGDNVVISIQGANSGLDLPAVQDLGNGTYQLRYTPTNLGQDTYTITLNGVTIGGGPYNKTIQGPLADPAKTQFTVTPGPLTAGDTVDISARLFDTNNNPTTAASVEFNITGANAQNITATYNTNTQTYEANVQAKIAGSDTYTISIDSVQVSTLSFTRTIAKAALDLTNTLFTVTPTSNSITTDETIAITISTRDAYGNIVYDSNNIMTITLPYANNALTLPAIKDNNDGTYTLSYQPEKTGTEYINLDINSGAYTSYVYKSIIGGTAVPDTLQVNIPPGTLSVLHDYLLSVDVLDQFSNPTSANVVFHITGANPQDITTSYGYNSTTKSNNNRATYIPSTLGTDSFTVTVDGVDIATVNETRVIGPNQLPTANAGADYVVIAGQPVNISGELSTDPEGRNLTYSWLMTSQPSGSTASLNSNTTIRPTFTPDQLGSYTFSLTVKDSFDSSLNTDTVTVTAKDALKLDAPGTKAAPSSTAKTAVNDAGDMIAVWTMTNGVNQKTVASFKPVNGNWESDVELLQVTTQHEIVSSGSTFFFFYSRGSKVYLREFNGTIWMDETQFDAEYIYGFDVQSDNDEISYMAYNNQNIRSRKFEFSSAGGNWQWSDFQEIFTTPPNQTTLYHYIQNPQLFTSNGTQGVVWNYRTYDTVAAKNTYDIYASVNNIGTWSIPEALVTDYTYQPNPRAENSENGMVVTWIDRRNIGTDIAPEYEYDFKARVFHTGAWTPTEAITTLTSSPQYSLVSNTSGYAIAWVEYDPLNTASPYSVFSMVFDYDSSLSEWTWSGLMTIDTNAQYTYAVNLVSNGINYAASWTKYDTSPAYSAFISTYDLSSQTWQLPTAIENNNNNISGSPIITSNGTGYATVFKQYDPGISTYNIFANVCKWSTSLNNCVWQTTATPLTTDSTSTGNPVVISNGVGYLVHWLQTTTSSPNSQLIHFVSYDTTSSTWGTTKTLNAPTAAATTENLAPISYLPNENYVFNWLHTSTDKVILYSSEFDGSALSTAENLVKLNHEGSLIETQSDENINGDILIVTKQYNEGYYDLYGSLYSNGAWQSQFLISKRISRYKLNAVDDQFIIVFEEMSDQFGAYSLNSISFNNSTGLSLRTNLSTTQSYYWKIESNDNSIAVVWAQSSKLYAKVYSGTTTLWDATETLLTPNSPANYYYYNAYSLSTNGVGYAVSWTSNVSSDDSGFVNIYKNGSWLGEQSIESGSTNIGNYSYNGAPQVASNGSSYLTVWGQLNADTNYYDIYVNEFDITSNSWGTESKIGEAGSGSVSLNLQGSSKGYIVNWYFYESLGLNNGYRRNMQLINPITGIAEWTNPDSTGCGNTIASKFEIYRNCSNTLDYLTYNSSLTSWEWLRQPGLNNVPLNSSYLAFNDKGDFASAYRNWNLGTYNGYLAIHYASSGWDTARVMGLGTNKEVVSNKADATNSGFTYHWRERNEVDNTLINGWIMVDLIP